MSSYEDCWRASRKEWKGPGGGVRVLGPAGVSWAGGVVAVGRWAPRRQLNGSPACAPVPAPVASRIPRSSQQTPDGKRWKKPERAAPPPPLDGRPQVGPPPPSQELFPGSESRPPRPRGESSCRRRRDARLLALHLTRRPQSRPGQPRLLPAPSPLPAASARPSLGWEVGGEGRRRPGARTRWLR